MLVGLTSGQKLGLVAVAAVFIGFALLSSFVFPRRNPDFPGPRGLRWFVLVTLLLLASMLTAMGVLAQEDEEGGEAVATETEPGETETGPGETEPAETETEPGTTTAGGEQGDPAAGKEVFDSAGCNGCHTLADAGASGTVGPNLDEAKPDYDLVVDRVTNGKGGMPAFKGRLSEEEIANVAAYVVQASGG